MDYNRTHAFTDHATIVTVIRSDPYLGDVGGHSSILCPRHRSDALDDCGIENIRKETTHLDGRHVCQECHKFGYNEHAALTKALKVSGSYTRQRGFGGGIGVVYNTDPTSPSGARASGTGFDPFCPHAMEVIHALANRMEPPRE
jgi:hypothetical protein